jgi:hypothetical protein
MHRTDIGRPSFNTVFWGRNRAPDVEFSKRNCPSDQRFAVYDGPNDEGKILQTQESSKKIKRIFERGFQGTIQGACKSPTPVERPPEQSFGVLDVGCQKVGESHSCSVGALCRLVHSVPGVGVIGLREGIPRRGHTQRYGRRSPAAICSPTGSLTPSTVRCLVFGALNPEILRRLGSWVCRAGVRGQTQPQIYKRVEGQRAGGCRGRSTWITIRSFFALSLISVRYAIRS